MTKNDEIVKLLVDRKMSTGKKIFEILENPH